MQGQIDGQNYGWFLGAMGQRSFYSDLFLEYRTLLAVDGHVFINIAYLEYLTDHVDAKALRSEEIQWRNLQVQMLLYLACNGLEDGSSGEIPLCLHVVSHSIDVDVKIGPLTLVSINIDDFELVDLMRLIIRVNYPLRFEFLTICHSWCA